VKLRQDTFATSRLRSLSDGVFTIAMTLLVLNLKLPPLGSSADQNVVSAALVEQLPRFVSWILSFAILCRLWITHHALLKAGKTRSPSFMAWNFVFLGVIAFIPFPTSLMSEHHNQALSVIIFSTTYAFAGLALVAMAVAYSKQLDTAGGSSEGIAVKRAAAIMLATALLSSLLALIHPWFGVLIWVLYPFVSALDFGHGRPGDLPADDESRSRGRGGLFL